MNWGAVYLGCWRMAHAHGCWQVALVSWHVDLSIELLDVLTICLLALLASPRVSDLGERIMRNPQYLLCPVSEATHIEVTISVIFFLVIGSKSLGSTWTQVDKSSFHHLKEGLSKNSYKYFQTTTPVMFQTAEPQPYCRPTESEYVVDPRTLKDTELISWLLWRIAR